MATKQFLERPAYMPARELRSTQRKNATTPASRCHRPRGGSAPSVTEIVSGVRGLVVVGAQLGLGTGSRRPRHRRTQPSVVAVLSDPARAPRAGRASTSRPSRGTDPVATIWRPRGPR